MFIQQCASKCLHIVERAVLHRRIRHVLVKKAFGQCLAVNTNEAHCIH